MLYIHIIDLVSSIIFIINDFKSRCAMNLLHRITVYHTDKVAVGLRSHSCTLPEVRWLEVVFEWRRVTRMRAAGQNLRFNICGPTFAGQNLRATFLRAKICRPHFCGSIFVGQNLRVNICGPTFAGHIFAGQRLRPKSAGQYLDQHLY